MGQFEIVQTEPEGEGKQPYFLRHVAGNNDKIVRSEMYAHRSGAEGALVALATTLMVTTDTLHVKWNPDRTKGYLVSSSGWMVSHAPILFVSEFEPAPPKVAKKPTRKAPAKKAVPAKKATKKPTRKTPHTHAHDPVLE